MFLFHLWLTEIGQCSVSCERFHCHSSEFWSDFPFWRHTITLHHTDLWPSLSFLVSIPWKNIRALFLLPVMLHWYHTGISETNSCITWNKTSPWLSVHKYKILRIPACWNMTWGIEITRRNEIYLAEQNKAWKAISSLIMKMSEETETDCWIGLLGWFLPK